MQKFYAVITEHLNKFLKAAIPCLTKLISEKN